jgi:hypothetical protein
MDATNLWLESTGSKFNFITYASLMIAQNFQLGMLMLSTIFATYTQLIIVENSLLH